jgi:glycosyltransferase involved in cell wall biosynthesis
MVGTPPPLKVCHVFASTEGGRWVYEQLEALRRDHGCEVCVVLPEGPGSTVDLFERAGIRIRRFDFKVWGLRNLLTLPVRFVQLALWMRRERFDVVQSHILPSTFFARPAAWLADVPVRLEMSTSPIYLQAPSIRWIEIATLWMETGIIPSCAVTVDLLRDAGVPERLIQPILYYGPPPEPFDPETAEPEGLRAEFGLPPETLLVGSIAVFYARCGESSFVPAELHNKYIKGHTDLIEAIGLVVREFPTASLVLIGKGWGPLAEQTERELHDFVRDKGLEHLVHFAGWRASTPAIYVDLDVSVQASISENLGGTVESLLMARPTVATRVGGMIDSVIDGETGVLANPSDPADLARAIVELLRDPERGARLGRAGREYMLSRFTLRTTAPALAELYRRQRGAARGAWRPHVLPARLLIGAFVAVPLAARMALIDIFAKIYLPHKARSVKRRLGKLAGMFRLSDAAHDPGGRAA